MISSQNLRLSLTMFLKKTGDYYVQCIAREDGTNLVELNLRVSEKRRSPKNLRFMGNEFP